MRRSLAFKIYNILMVRVRLSYIACLERSKREPMSTGRKQVCRHRRARAMRIICQGSTPRGYSFVLKTDLFAGRVQCGHRCGVVSEWWGRAVDALVWISGCRCSSSYMVMSSHGKGSRHHWITPAKEAQSFSTAIDGHGHL
jgi:hypothetical protein